MILLFSYQNYLLAAKISSNTESHHISAVNGTKPSCITKFWRTNVALRKYFVSFKCKLFLGRSNTAGKYRRQMLATVLRTVAIRVSLLYYGELNSVEFLIAATIPIHILVRISSSGDWTSRFISNLDMCANCKHEEIKYFYTQMLSV